MELRNMLILTKKDSNNQIIGLDICSFANNESTIFMLRELVELLKDKEIHKFIKPSLSDKVLVTVKGDEEIVEGKKLFNIYEYLLSSYYSPLTTQQIFAKAADLLEERS